MGDKWEQLLTALPENEPLPPSDMSDDELACAVYLFDIHLYALLDTYARRFLYPKQYNILYRNRPLTRSPTPSLPSDYVGWEPMTGEQAAAVIISIRAQLGTEDDTEDGGSDTPDVHKHVPSRRVLR